MVPVPVHFKEGDRFVATGTLPSCESCWLKEKCSVLKRGWLYEVKTRLGVVEHPCKIHGKVVVAEVEEIGIPVIVPSNLVLEGSTVEYSPIYCENRKCPLWEDCTGKRHKLGRRVKVKIKEVVERVECPKGLSLYKVIGIPQSVKGTLTKKGYGRKKKSF